MRCARAPLLWILLPALAPRAPADVGTDCEPGGIEYQTVQIDGQEVAVRGPGCPPPGVKSDGGTTSGSWEHTDGGGGYDEAARAAHPGALPADSASADESVATVADGRAQRASRAASVGKWDAPSVGLVPGLLLCGGVGLAGLGLLLYARRVREPAVREGRAAAGAALKAKQEDERARLVPAGFDSDDEEPQAKEQSKLYKILRFVDAAKLKMSAFKVSAAGIFVLGRWLPLQDVGSDALVTFGPDGLYWDARNPWWGHLSVLFMVIPYVILWILIAPIMVPVIERHIDFDGIWMIWWFIWWCLWIPTGSLIVVLTHGWLLIVWFPVVFALLIGGLRSPKKMLSILMWFIFGLPFCMVIDVICFVRYPFWHPRQSWLLNALRLRVVLETMLESPSQVGLQTRIFLFKLMSSKAGVHEDFDIMSFGTLLLSIGTSILSTFLTIQDIRAMSEEQHIGFWETMMDQFLVGLGRKAPLLHVIKMQTDVDFGEEGRLKDEHFEQISASASSSQVLHTLTFNQSNGLSKANFLSLFEFISRRKYPLMSRVTYVAEGDGDCLWCGCGRFTAEELESNADSWANPRVHLELHDVIPPQRLTEIAEKAEHAYSRVHVVAAGNSGRHELLKDEALTDLARRLPASAASIDINFHRKDMFTNDSLKILAQLLPAGATFVRLTFRGGEDFNDDGLKELAQKLPTAVTDVRLNFVQNNKFTDDGLTELAQSLPTAATDVCLNFTNNNMFTDDGMKALAKGVPAKATRFHLECGSNDKFSDDGLKELAQSLPTAATDVRLTFTNNDKFTDDGLKALAKGLPAKTTHFHLDCGGSGEFTDVGLKELAKSLRRTVATDVNLIFTKNNKFTDDGLKALAKGLPDKATRFHLDFGGSEKFTDDGLKELAQSLHDGLKELAQSSPTAAADFHLNFVKNNKFTRKGLKALVEGLATAAIIDLDFSTNDKFTKDVLEVLSAEDQEHEAIRIKTNNSLLMVSPSNINRCPFGGNLKDDGFKSLAQRLNKDTMGIHVDIRDDDKPSNDSLTDDWLSALAGSLPAATAATHIHLDFRSNDTITDDGLKALAERLPASATNIHLNFTGNTKFTDDGLMALAQGLPPSATHIRLNFTRNNTFTDAGLKALARGLPASATDIHLNFTKNNKFTDEGLKALAKGLPAAAIHIQLNFMENDKFTDNGLKALAVGLPAAATHIKLNFKENDKFTDDGLKALAVGLPVSATDVFLNFMKNNRFTDDGMQAFAQCLPASATNINLNFMENDKFMDDGLKALAKGLPAAATHIQLNFTNNKKFTDTGLMALAQHLPASATDIRLDFKNSTFTDAGLKALAEGLPDAATDIDLNFSKNNTFTEDGLKAFVQSLPAAVIVAASKPPPTKIRFEFSSDYAQLNYTPPSPPDPGSNPPRKSAKKCIDDELKDRAEDLAAGARAMWW